MHTKIFGRGGAAALLEKITTDDFRGSKLESCIKNQVRKLEKNMGKLFSDVVRASLVAVLQSPLHGERPTLLKLKKGEPLPLIRPPYPPNTLIGLAANLATALLGTVRATAAAAAATDQEQEATPSRVHHDGSDSGLVDLTDFAEKSAESLMDFELAAQIDLVEQAPGGDMDAAELLVDMSPPPRHPGVRS